ncbi:MAG TPA: CDP-alcohol phosphatidyltransferase family protein [Bryobacteraceae bacterium]|nr:CDP-alcohol phosphatidyltransferase family protein [Bryobacteraceae bacterium]
MQAVIALPAPDTFDAIDRPVCGVPVLTRIIATAVRSGVARVLIVSRPGLPGRRLAAHLESSIFESATIEILEVDPPFDAGKADAWSAIAHCLDERFLWLPYGYLPHRTALADLLQAAASHPDPPMRFSSDADTGPGEHIFQRPTVLRKRDLLEGNMPEFQVVIAQGQPEIRLDSPADIRAIEKELVRTAGKITDGIYSRFNRRLCAPFVRWLCHTPVSPNAVSLCGLVVALLAGLCFAEGSWAFSVAGAALFFVAGLFDEMDGMLARLKFRASAVGCWLETAVDYTTYLILFAGLTAGGYRRGNEVYLLLGAVLVGGSVLSFLVISRQRRLATPSDAPNEFGRRYLAALEQDSANPVSRVVRQIQFLTKKSVLIHYLLLFALLDLLPLFMALAAFGANAAWIVSLYLNRRLFLTARTRRVSDPALNGNMEAAK